MLTFARKMFLVPSLQAPPPARPAPKTASTPAAAVERLRSLHDQKTGWAARVQARRAELSELTPDDPRDALDVSDETMAEAARLQLQVEMGETAIARISADESALIHAVVDLIEALKDEVEVAVSERLATVESKASAHLAKIFPAENLSRAIAMLPAVAHERGVAVDLRCRASCGIRMMSSGGPNPRPVPRPDTDGGQVVQMVDRLNALVVEAKARLDLPVSFVLEPKSNGNGKDHH